MNKLTYNDLLSMEGMEVLVVDTVPYYSNGEPIEHQKCTVGITNVVCSECGHLYKLVTLENEIYIFEYDRLGNCLDGEFDVYEVE